MTILGRSEELVSRCVECDLAEPESLASLGGAAPGVVDGILSFLPIQDFDWTYSLYGNVHELLLDDMPDPLGEAVTTATTMDANLNHCLATGKSLTACLHFVNKTPVDWYSKKQPTVETSTYGSEFVAAKTATEQIMDIRQTLRYLGAPIATKSVLFGDNRFVVTSATLPHSTLTKKAQHSCISQS